MQTAETNRNFAYTNKVEKEGILKRLKIPFDRLIGHKEPVVEMTADDIIENKQVTNRMINLSGTVYPGPDNNLSKTSIYIPDPVNQTEKH